MHGVGGQCLLPSPDRLVGFPQVQQGQRAVVQHVGQRVRRPRLGPCVSPAGRLGVNLLQRARDVREIRPAVVRLGLQAAEDHVGQRGRQRRGFAPLQHARDRRVGHVAHAQPSLPRHAFDPGQPSAQQRPQRYAKRKDVGPTVDLPAGTDLFGRCVARRPGTGRDENAARHRALTGLARHHAVTCQTKVRHLGRALSRHQHVLRLQIAMNQALGVRERHPPGDLDGGIENQLEIRKMGLAPIRTIGACPIFRIPIRTIGACPIFRLSGHTEESPLVNPVFQTAAFDEFGEHAGNPAQHADVVARDSIRVQAQMDPGLAFGDKVPLIPAAGEQPRPRAFDGQIYVPAAVMHPMHPPESALLMIHSPLGIERLDLVQIQDHIPRLPIGRNPIRDRRPTRRPPGAGILRHGVSKGNARPGTVRRRVRVWHGNRRPAVRIRTPELPPRMRWLGPDRPLALGTYKTDRHVGLPFNPAPGSLCVRVPVMKGTDTTR